MSRWLFVVPRLLWVGSAILVLFITLKYYDGSPKSDAEILLIYGMQVLSFPIGILVSLVVVAVSEFLHLVHAHNYQASYASIILEWVSWLAAGYWQWFKATPWLYRKVQSRIIVWRKSKTSQ